MAGAGRIIGPGGGGDSGKVGGRCGLSAAALTNVWRRAISDNRSSGRQGQAKNDMRLVVLAALAILDSISSRPAAALPSSSPVALTEAAGAISLAVTTQAQRQPRQRATCRTYRVCGASGCKAVRRCW